jgi:GDP-4-dehydro-6-deoxy-D-mannose reductase
MSDFAYQIAQIKLNKKEPFLKAGNLKAERDFTDVRDVVQAYIILADKGERGQVYNIGSGTANSIEYYLNKMIEKASIDIKIEVEKERFRPIDTPLICCDNSKIKELGWIPKHNIADTFMEMIDYHKQSIPGSNQ